MVITIDGPVASGKSTLARRLAHALRFYFVSSGYLYRALAYLLLRDGVSMQQLATVAEQQIESLVDAKRFIYDYDPERGATIRFDEEDITPYLKTPEIDLAASIIATDNAIRELLRRFQRTLACHQDVIFEGRDCGSAVFPDAEIKFFLTATPEVRARRWQRDQELRGNAVSFEQALETIVERDVRDTTRAVAPLIVPQQAVGIDNSHLDQDTTLAIMLDVVRERLTQVERSA